LLVNGHTVSAAKVIYRYVITDGELDTRGRKQT
jgi:hypothetical protein